MLLLNNLPVFEEDGVYADVTQMGCTQMLLRGRVVVSIGPSARIYKLAFREFIMLLLIKNLVELMNVSYYIWAIISLREVKYFS